MQSYFSHDSNARNSDKLIKVRMDLGAEGYGIFFMLIERLREEEGYKSTIDYNILAFDLKVDPEKIKQVVENYDLFKFTEDGKYFYSDSFNDRMEMMDVRAQQRISKAKKAANARWNKQSKDTEDTSNAQAMLKQCSSNAQAMLKQCSSNAQAMLNHANKIKLNKIKLNKIKLNKIKQNKIKLNKITTNKKTVVVSSSNLNQMVEYYKTLFGKCNKNIEKDIDRALGLFGRDKVISSFRESVKAENPYRYMKGIWKNWENEMNASNGQGKNEGGGAMVVPMVSWAKKTGG